MMTNENYDLDYIIKFLEECNNLSLQKEFSIHSTRLNKKYKYRIYPDKQLHNLLKIDIYNEDLQTFEHLGQIDAIILRLKEYAKSSLPYKVLQYFLEVINGHLPWPQTMIFEPTCPPIAIRCSICGRVLTDAASIAKGFGPVCEQHIKKEDYNVCIIF